MPFLPKKLAPVLALSVWEEDEIKKRNILRIFLYTVLVYGH
jgi:hypothetical protein